MSLYQNGSNNAMSAGDTSRTSGTGGVFANTPSSGGAFANSSGPSDTQRLAGAPQDMATMDSLSPANDPTSPSNVGGGQMDPAESEAAAAGTADTLVGNADGKGGVSGDAKAQTDRQGDGAADTPMESLMNSLRQLIEQLDEILGQLGSSQKSGIVDDTGGVRGEDGPGDGGDGSTPLSTPQGPSERIPDPTENVRTFELGGKTMTMGSDGTATKAEVDQAEAEVKQMYENSPSFRETINSADTNDLTMTLGKRGDNTSWGGGGRVFLNLNNVSPSGDTFQELVGHEWGHAAGGLGHGPELEALEERVRNEA